MIIADTVQHRIGMEMVQHRQRKGPTAGVDMLQHTRRMAIATTGQLQHHMVAVQRRCMGLMVVANTKHLLHRIRSMISVDIV